MSRLILVLSGCDCDSFASPLVGFTFEAVIYEAMSKQCAVRAWPRTTVPALPKSGRLYKVIVESDVSVVTSDDLAVKAAVRTSEDNELVRLRQDANLVDTPPRQVVRLDQSDLRYPPCFRGPLPRRRQVIRVDLKTSGGQTDIKLVSYFASTMFTISCCSKTTHHVDIRPWPLSSAEVEADE